MQCYNKMIAYLEHIAGYRKRMQAIGGMLPVDPEGFYSRWSHQQRDQRVLHLVLEEMGHQNDTLVLTMASYHNIGRMPYVHFMERYLRHTLGWSFSQLETQQHTEGRASFRESLRLFHDTGFLQVNEHQIGPYPMSAKNRAARIIYLSDKLTGFIEDTLLAYKLGIIEEVPEQFRRLFHLRRADLERIAQCTKSQFDETVESIATNWLAHLWKDSAMDNRLARLESAIYELNHTYRKAYIEPIIFTSLFEKVKSDDLLSAQLFSPIIRYLETIMDRQTIIGWLMSATESQFEQVGRNRVHQESWQAIKQRLHDLWTTWRIENVVG